jgi:hypothetical protein
MQELVLAFFGFAVVVALSNIASAIHRLASAVGRVEAHQFVLPADKWDGYVDARDRIAEMVAGLSPDTQEFMLEQSAEAFKELVVKRIREWEP